MSAKAKETTKAPENATTNTTAEQAALKEAPKQEQEKAAVTGPPKTAAQVIAEAAQKKLNDSLIEQAKQGKKLEGDDLKTFIHEETEAFTAIGNDLKAAGEKSAERWARWAPQIEMKTTIDGKLDIMKFCDAIWSMLEPSAKIEMDGKPGKYYKWSVSAKWKHPASMAIENMRNYLRNNGAMLYPELLGTEVVDKTLQAYKKVANALDTIFKLEYLPKVKFVAVDENNVPIEGAKAETLAELLQDFYNEAVKPHLPKKEGLKEKAEAAEKEQIAEQVAAHEAETAEAKK